MKVEKQIPIIVGVTGHRALRIGDTDALQVAVIRELQALRQRVPHSPVVLLTSLAEGGDLLCADAARTLQIPVAAALPMEQERFTKDFPAEDRLRFETHCRDAADVFVVPFTEEPQGDADADFLYRQAGIYISSHCHVLLALWDGGQPTPDGCGTAEAVAFALNGAYRPKGGMPLRSADNVAVIHILTPRGDQTGAAGETRQLGNIAASAEILSRTDEFNRLAAETETQHALLPGQDGEDGVLLHLETLYHAADTLSIRHAVKYRRALSLLALASTVVAAAFLLYDEVNLSWMLIVCGAMLACAWLCSRSAKKSGCHRRYLEYRALAEALRVQAFLRYAGSPLEAAELFGWAQREETAWVLAALCALTVGKAPQHAHEISECWVDAQRQYHHGAQKRSARRAAHSDRIVQAALMASIAMYAAGLALELLSGGLLFRPAFALPRLETWRVVLKVALGSLSAATLFISNYYGKLSLPRACSDHAKLERFYAAAAGRLKQDGQTEALLRQLAHEELIENGNWCSYQRDNAPDLSL